MTDKPRPEEIEGSPERAADRGQPFGFGAFNAPISTGIPYLGDEETVEDILRDLLLRVHEVAGSEDAVKTIEPMVEQTAAIFYGQDDAYQAMPFNSQEQLGRYVNEVFGTKEDEKQTVQMLLWNMIRQVMEARQELLQGNLSDDNAQFRVEAALEDATTILLGLPLEGAD